MTLAVDPCPFLWVVLSRQTQISRNAHDSDNGKCAPNISNQGLFANVALGMVRKEQMHPSLPLRKMPMVISDSDRIPRLRSRKSKMMVLVWVTGYVLEPRENELGNSCSCIYRRTTFLLVLLWCLSNMILHAMLLALIVERKWCKRQLVGGVRNAARRLMSLHGGKVYINMVRAEAETDCFVGIS